MGIPSGKGDTAGTVRLASGALYAGNAKWKERHFGHAEASALWAGYPRDATGQTHPLHTPVLTERGRMDDHHT